MTPVLKHNSESQRVECLYCEVHHEGQRIINPEFAEHACYHSYVNVPTIVLAAPK